MYKLPNYYTVLGVAPDASAEEIQAAARALREKFPKEAQDPGNNVAFRQLVRAYEVLGNEERRAAYDKQLAQSGSELLEIELLPSRRAIRKTDREQLLYLLINLSAPPENGGRRQPINLCLVFDRSTSMRLERLKRVKAAAKEVINTLSSDDIVSVITFSDRAEVIIPAGHVRNKSVLLKSINQIEASGGTEIYQGLKAGVRELRKAPSSKYVHNLVLLTDGQTYGDEDECLALARSVAEQGVSISAFGIGTDWNDTFLDQLVSPAGGYSAYIESVDRIVSHLQTQVEGLGAIYAKDISLSFDPPAAVNCKDLFKVAPFAQPLRCPRRQLKLGAVEGGLPLAVLMELEVRTPKFEDQISLSFTINATIPSRQIRQRSFERSLALKVVAGEPQLSPPAQVLQAVQMLNLHRMNEKAWQELQAGDTNKATRRMERLTSRLMESGYEELAHQALIETQRLSHLGTISLEGRKKLKYGTRSLITKTMHLREDG